MVALIAVAALGLFAAGVAAGFVGVASLAIRREEKNFILTGKVSLTDEATDTVTRGGRWLNGVYVRTPCDPAAVGP